MKTQAKHHGPLNLPVLAKGMGKHPKRLNGPNQVLTRASRATRSKAAALGAKPPRKPGFEVSRAEVCLCIFIYNFWVVAVPGIVAAPWELLLLYEAGGVSRLAQA